MSAKRMKVCGGKEEPMNERTSSQNGECAKQKVRKERQKKHGKKNEMKIQISSKEWG